MSCVCRDLLNGTKIVSTVIEDNCNQFFLHYSPFVNDYERAMKLVERLSAKKSKVIDCVCVLVH